MAYYFKSLSFGGLLSSNTQLIQMIKSSLKMKIVIQCNCNKNPRKLFWGYQQTDSKVYMEKQKIQNSPLNIDGEEQSWRTGATQHNDL